MASRRSRKRRKRPISILIFAVLGILCLLVGLTQTAWGRERLRTLAVTAIHDGLGLSASLAQVRVDFDAFPPGISVAADGIILEDPVYGRFAEAKTLTVRPSLLSILMGGFDLNEIVLEEPVIHLIVREGEVRNFPRPRTKSKSNGPVKLPLKSFVAKHAAVTIDASPYAMGDLVDVDLRVDRESDYVMRIRVDGSSGRLDHEKGTEVVQRILADVNVDTETGRIEVANALLRTPQLRVGASDAHVVLPLRYDYGGNVDVKLKLSHLKNLPVKQKLPKLEGWLEASAQLKGSPKGPVGEGEALLNGAKIKVYGLGETVLLPFKISPDGVTVEDGAVQLVKGGGRVTLTGSVGFGEGLPLDFKLGLDDMSFPQLMEQLNVSDKSIVSWLFNGKASLSGTLDPLSLSGPIRLKMRDFMITQDAYYVRPRRRIMGVTNAQGVAQWNIRPDGMRFERLVIDTPHSKIHSEVFLSFSKEVRVTARTENLDARDVTPLVNFPLAGRGPVNVVVAGNYSLPTVKGHAAFAGFAFDGMKIGDIESDFELAKNGNAMFMPSIAVSNRGSRYKANDFLLDFSNKRFEITSDVVASRVTFEDLYHTFGFENDERYSGYQGFSRGKVKLRYTQGFPNDPPTGRIYVDLDLDLDTLDLDGFAFNDGKFIGKVDWHYYDRGAEGMKLDIKHLSMRKGDGSVTVSGKMELGAKLNLNVAADSLKFRDTEGVGDTIPELTGTYSVLGEVRGTADVPLAHLDVGLNGIAWDGARLGNGRLYVRLTERADPWVSKSVGGSPADTTCINARRGFAKGRWRADPPKRTVDGLIPAAAKPMAYLVCGDMFGGQLGMDVAIGRTQALPVRGKVMARNFVLDKVLSQFAGGVSGRGKVSGEVLLTAGAIQDENSFGGKVRLTDVHVGTSVVDIVNDGNVDVKLKKGGFEVGKAVFTSGTSKLAISGSGSPRSGMAVQVDGSAELGLLSTFIPTLESATGNLGIRVNVSGAFSDPVVFGSAKVKNGGLRVAGLPVPLEGLNGGVTFSERQILVENMRAKVGGGTMVLGGSAALRDRGLAEFDMDVDLKGVSMTPQEGVEVTISTDAKLAWTRGERLPLLSGKLFVDRALYERAVPVALFNLGEFNQPKRQQAERYDPAADNVAIDLRIVQRRPIRIANNILDATIRIEDSETPFRVVGTDQRYGVLGQLSIPQGIAHFRNTDLNIRSGIINFRDETQVNPSFDIRATTEINRNDDTNETGWRIQLRARGLSDNFQLTASSQPQLSQEDIAGLLTFGMTRAEVQRLQAADVGVAALDALGQLTGANEAVSNVIPVIDEFQFASQYSSRTGRQEPQVTVGKRITDRVKVTASTGLSSETRSFQARLKMRVSDHTNFQVFYDNIDRENASSFGNLGVGFRWRLEFD